LVLVSVINLKSDLVKDQKVFKNVVDFTDHFIPKSLNAKRTKFITASDILVATTLASHLPGWQIKYTLQVNY